VLYEVKWRARREELVMSLAAAPGPDLLVRRANQYTNNPWTVLFFQLLSRSLLRGKQGVLLPSF
jgi:hypothetical protein